MIRRLDLPLIEPVIEPAPADAEPEIASPWWARADAPRRPLMANAVAGSEAHDDLSDCHDESSGDEQTSRAMGAGDLDRVAEELDDRSDRPDSDQRNQRGPKPQHRSGDVLRNALRNQQLVRITFGQRNQTVVDGVVKAVGRRWILVARIHPELFWDGFIALRRDDIVMVRTPDNIVTRWVAHTPGPLHDLSAIDVDSTGRLISTIHDATPLVQIHVTDIDPAVVIVGTVERAPNKSLAIQWIDDNGRWADGEPIALRRSAMSHIIFGANYDRALIALAEESWAEESLIGQAPIEESLATDAPD
jgi:hypothetical protein